MQSAELSEGLADFSLRMLKFTLSTAGLKKAFSTMGFFHSGLRNRLTRKKFGNCFFVFVY